MDFSILKDNVKKGKNKNNNKERKESKNNKNKNNKELDIWKIHFLVC